MTAQDWLTVLGAIGFSTILAALIGFVGTRASLRANQPKTKAETEEIATKTARDTVEHALKTLRADLADTRLRAIAAEERADRAEERADKADRRAEDAAARNRVLSEHVWRLTSWVKRAVEQGTVQGMEPPPVLENFEKPNP